MQLDSFHGWTLERDAESVSCVRGLPRIRPLAAGGCSRSRCETAVARFRTFYRRQLLCELIIAQPLLHAGTVDMYFCCCVA